MLRNVNKARTLEDPDLNARHKLWIQIGLSCVLLASFLPVIVCLESLLFSLDLSEELPAVEQNSPRCDLLHQTRMCNANINDARMY